MNDERVYLEDEEKEIVPPYYRIMYVDDYGYKHIAMIKDEVCLNFLKDRYTVLECNFIEK